MSEMVERVQEAILKSLASQGLLMLSQQFAVSREHNVAVDVSILARAAIEAMRKPTEEMARAFFDNGGPEDDFWPIEWYGNREGFDNALGRFIDTALAHK